MANLKNLGTSKKVERSASEEPAPLVAIEIDICGFSEADKDKVLAIYDLEELKKEF